MPNRIRQHGAGEQSTQPQIQMANTLLFPSARGSLVPATDTRNNAGGAAHSLSPRAQLARLASTGCLTPTFYTSAEVQLHEVLKVTAKLAPSYLARTALYARRKGFMKDMPALLCAILATRDITLLEKIFPEVIDNGRMLRTFVQILRSGVTGRRSLGTAPKRLVRNWLENASDWQLINAAIGTEPSLADIVKMVHPRPKSPSREAFYGWLLGKNYREDLLPEAIRQFECWKTKPQIELPDMPFQYLTALPLQPRDWTRIALSSSWQTTRMNLNTFARHDVLKNGKTVRALAKRLADPEMVRRARVFPYQLLAAYLNASSNVPTRLRNALQDAMEVALENVPAIKGKVVVCCDVSGSMSWPVTGWNQTATTKVRCVDVAGLMSAAILRRNPEARVLPFENEVVKLRLNTRDTVITNATRLANIGGGGTNCSAPLRQLNREKANPDLVIFVSDNESWMDSRNIRGTQMMKEWEQIRCRNKKARLVCLDIVPNTTTQAPDREDILNISGFNDSVFKVIASFAQEGNSSDHWVREIENENYPR